MAMVAANSNCFAWLVLRGDDHFDILLPFCDRLFASKYKTRNMYSYILYEDIKNTLYFSNSTDFEFWRILPLGFSNRSKLSSRAHDLLSSVEQKVCGKYKGKGRHFLVCPP